MGIEKRIERLETQAGGDGELRIKVIIVQRHGDRDPTEAEEEAAIEDYRQKHGDGPIVILTWDGEKFVDK